MASRIPGRLSRYIRRGVIPALFLVLCSGCQSASNSASDFGAFGQRLFAMMSGRTVSDAARKMEDTQSPDKRWSGIATLAKQGFGKKPPYTKRYAQIAVSDDDWFVRATAVRALNRSRDASATDLFIKSLSDPSTQVRLEAAKALVNVPDEKAVPELMKIVDSDTENKDVRIAAADALRHYHKLEVARALVNTLSEREFGVAWQSHKSLVLLTGKDLRYDEAAWLAFLTGPDKPFG